MASKNSSYQVIIAGAGPVGLLTALRLGQENIQTLVLEAHHELLPTTRAMVYMPVVNRCLEQLGLADVMREHAYHNRAGVTWRNKDCEQLAHLSLPADENGKFGGSYHIGQARMSELILDKLRNYNSVEVKFGMRVGGIEDDESDTVKVMAHQAKAPGNDGNDIFFRTKYVLAADGSNSAVRRLLCIPFDGFTFDEFKMVGTDVLFDCQKEFDWSPLNFIVDPQHWAVVAYAGQDGGALDDPEDKRPLWRVAFSEPSDLPATKEETQKRAHDRIKLYLKDRKDYKLVRAELYWLHQRCAAQASKGRVFLAGDALHSNNPIGGLGLTGGILDAYAYGNAFTRVIQHGEPDSLLANCANSRRDAWLNATSQFALGNLHRLKGTDGKHAEERKEFFESLNNDPGFPAQFMNNLDKMIPETFEMEPRKISLAERPASSTQ